MKILHMKAGLSLLVAGSIICCSTLSSGALYAGNENTQERKKIEQNIDDTAKSLQILAQHEIDASALIGQAIDNVENKTIKDQLINIKKVCEKNIVRLASLIQQYGRKAPAHTKDFKGYFMQGYLAMRGWTSDQGLMRALHSNLQVMMSAYENALKKALPEDAKEQVSQLYEDARRRLQYAESQM